MAACKIVFIFAICICVTNGMSFLKKYNMYSFGVDAKLHGKTYNGKELISKPCEDGLIAAKCKQLRLFCGTDQRVREQCRKSCGLCQAVQPKCKKSEFGCCWDNTTAAVGQERKCPACIDDTVDCGLLKINCEDELSRRLCPVSCGVCGDANCHDDQHQAEICPGYKEIGACESAKSLMEKYCTKTCGFC